MLAVALRAPIMKFEDQPDGSLLVTGRMVTEDLDRQNEITDYEGAKRAAEKWSGNIREMHQLKAVGRAIDVMPNDAEKAIYIRGRISAGASDTIIKIKDGTLRDFSIGGSVNPNGRVAVKVGAEFAATYNVPTEKIGKSVTVLKDWDMAELSVVDSGANPNARIEIVKSIGGVLTMTDAVAKNVLAEFIADVVAEPNPAHEEPEAPMEDEKTIVACLVAARRHLEAAAKMEVDELEENGSDCLSAMTGCITAIRSIEQMKILQGAAEIASTGVIPMNTVVEMSQRISDVKKGMVSYKIDKKEAKALAGMKEQLMTIVTALEDFVGQYGEQLSEAAPAEDVPAEPASEEVPDGEAEKMQMEAPAGEMEKGCGEMGKAIDEGGGEVAQQEEAKPFAAKAIRAGSIQKSAGDPVVKAVQGIMASFEKKLEGMQSQIHQLSSQPATGGPIRMAMAVEKSIMGKDAPAASVVDEAISAAFGSMSKSQRQPTESDLRFELAKQLAKSAPRV